MRYWDWMEYVIAGMFLFFGALIVLVIYVAWIETNSEKIEITKSKWECTQTKSITTLMLVGKIIMPQTSTYCVKYEKIGETE